MMSLFCFFLSPRYCQFPWLIMLWYSLLSKCGSIFISYPFFLRLICPCCLSHRWWVESNRSVISWGILVTFPPFSLVNFSHFSLCLINKWNKWNQLCRDASRMVLHILWFLFHCKFSMAAMVSYAFWLAKISNLYFSETTYVWKCYIHMTLFKVCVVFVEKKSNMSAIARQIFTLWKNK